MILLTSIDITNIRSIAHGAIEPLPGGITTLVGAIGTGKSTFLEVARWVLYGEVSGGYKQVEMRRHGANGQKCEATVEFTLGGTVFRAVRGLRQKTAGGRLTEIAYAELFINGERQPLITPTKLTDKVTQLSGLTGRAFTGAFFIPQNRLPVLAQGTPSEVQQVFEEQTGLTPLTRRVEIAQREANQALAAADALPGSAEAATAAQKAFDAAQVEGALARRRLKIAKAAADKAEDALASTQAAHDALVGQRSAAEQARLDAARTEARAASLDETIRDLGKQIRNLPGGDQRDAHDRLTRLRAARQAAEHASRIADLAAGSVKDAHTRHNRAQQQLGRLPVDLDERLDDARKDQVRAEQAVGRFAGEYSRLDRAVHTLRSADARAARCPTCNQKVADLAGLLRDLIVQKSHCESESHRAVEHTRIAAAKTTKLMELLRQREAATDALRQAESDVHDAVARQGDVLGEAKAAFDNLVTLLQVTEDDRSKILAKAGEVEDATAQEVNAAQYAAEIRTRFTKARSDRAQVQRTLDELHARADSAPTLEDLGHLAGRLAEAREDWETRRACRVEAQTAVEVLAERCRMLAAARDSEQKLFDQRLAAQHRANILRHAGHILAGLRRDLLAEYTATISEAATDLLRRIGGEHNAFHIDHRFVPEVVLDDGTRRPLRTLSGGEQARSALCFCLGISTQITGGNHTGTIIADEIIAAHDDETRHAIIELLRDLSWPLLIVAHSPEIAEIANRVFWFNKPDEASGTQVTSAPNPTRC